MIHLESKKLFCSAPFTQLTLYPDGNIAICCYNEKTILGNIKTHSFAEIWNGDKIKKIRQEFLSKKSTFCQSQISSRACHHFAGRRTNKGFIKQINQTQYPIRFDLRLNGACNLKCTMCDSHEQPNGIYDSSFLWSDGPEHIFPNLASLDLLGGEPFIQKDTFRLIDSVFAVNTECLWSFSTNGNVNFKEDIAPKITKLNIDWIMISIDSLIPKTYKLIRKGGNLKHALQTIEDACQLRDIKNNNNNHKMKLFGSMCVQKINYLEMVDFYNYCINKDILPIFHYCSGKQKNSLDNLNTAEARTIITYIESNFRDDKLRTSFEVHSKLIQNLTD